MIHENRFTLTQMKTFILAALFFQAAFETDAHAGDLMVTASYRTTDCSNCPESIVKEEADCRLYQDGTIELQHDGFPFSKRIPVAPDLLTKIHEARILFLGDHSGSNTTKIPSWSSGFGFFVIGIFLDDSSSVDFMSYFPGTRRFPKVGAGLIRPFMEACKGSEPETRPDYPTVTHTVDFTVYKNNMKALEKLFDETPR